MDEMEFGDDFVPRSYAEKMSTRENSVLDQFENFSSFVLIIYNGMKLELSTYNNTALQSILYFSIKYSKLEHFLSFHNLSKNLSVCQFPSVPFYFTATGGNWGLISRTRMGHIGRAIFCHFLFKNFVAILKATTIRKLF